MSYFRMSRHVRLLVLLLLAWLPLLAFAAPTSPGAISRGNGVGPVLSSGNVHSCGLRSDGSAVCWGSSGNGRTAPPAGTRFVSLASGGSHTCGLQADGTALCWGLNTSGQTAVPQGVQFRSLMQATGDHSCGLRLDGTALCWGSNDNGQTNAPVGVVFTALAGGDDHTCGLRTDGTAQCWGQTQFQGTPPAGVAFTAIVAGQGHTCGLKADGTAACWGYNSSGQTVVPTGVTFTALAASYRSTCGLRTDGVAQCWGENTFGTRNVPTGETFVALTSGLAVTCGLRTDGSALCWGTSASLNVVPGGARFGLGAFSAGTFHTCKLRADGSAGCFGANGTGETVPPADAFAQVAAGYAYSCGLHVDGTIACWGTGYTGDGSLAPPAGTFTQVDAGLYSACAVGTSGAVTCWGENNFGEASPPAGSFVQVSTGYSSSCGIATDGTLQCWGDPSASQPPSGTFVQVSSGWYHHCGLRTDATLACWGNDNNSGSTAAPAGTFRSLSVDAQGACAVRTDGTVACWGDIASLGTTPTGPVAQLSKGYQHACAIRDDGTSVCWGGSSSGQAPTVTLTPTTLPAIVGGQPYSAQFSLSGYSYVAPTPGFAVIDGSVPAGMSLAPTGELTGTPTTDGTYTFTVEGEDANAFADHRDYTLIADTSPPVITPSVTGTLGGNDWYTGDVSVSWTVTDAQSAVTSTTGCDPTSLTSDSLGTTYNCSATSGGGTSSQSVTVKRDATAPDTVITAQPADPSDSANASFVFSGSDDTSGVAGVACSLDGAAFTDCTTGRDRSGSVTYSNLADGSHTFQVRSTDNAGLVDETPATYTWVIDTDDTAPVIVPTVSGLLGSNGWYVGNVSVSWSVTDAESAISSTSGCDASSVTSDTAGISFTCTATSIGGTASSTVTVKRDATAPVVSASATTAPNAAGWYRGNVTVAHTCSDALSGVVACPSSQTLSAEGAAVSSSPVTIVDRAGNSSAPSNVVTVKIDRTAPSLAPVVSPNPLLLNASTAATANGSDALSGVATQSCAALATSVVGTRQVSCTVTDVAGNSRSASTGYRVVYGFAGFERPIRNGVWNSIPLRKSAPFIWRTFDANGAAVTGLPNVALTVTPIACTYGRLDGPLPLLTYGGSNAALQELGGGRYQRDVYVLQPRDTCASISIDLGDGVAHSAKFVFAPSSNTPVR